MLQQQRRSGTYGHGLKPVRFSRLMEATEIIKTQCGHYQNNNNNNKIRKQLIVDQALHRSALKGHGFRVVRFIDRLY